MSATPILRRATEADAFQIAKLHAASWMVAYRGLLSDAYLDNDLAGERIAYWSKKMKALTDKEFVLVATGREGGLEGFIAVLDQPQAGFVALVDNLHVQPGLKGRGIGRMLMQAAARELLESGRTNYYLWVLNGNEPACRFYESIGGVSADETTVHFGGKDVKATRYGWSSFDVVLR